MQQTWPHPDIQADLATLRRHEPLTHCLTNIVAAGFTANVLLAIGASPAMVVADEEVAAFAAMANGLLINLGTITRTTARTMESAARTAARAGTPWVLDPVAIGALGFRRRVALDLLTQRPAVIRGNASEILTLAGAEGGGKGVDSTADSAASVSRAATLAARTGAVVAVSGAVDYVTDGTEIVEVPGGDRMMTRVTGTGCALGSLMAAFLGAGIAPLRAATAASAVFAHAGERAASRSSGPGSFAVAFVDALATIGTERD